MRALAVKLSDTVICYDAGTMQFFGHRAAWMFKAMGHPNVKVLDGGLPKWIKDGFPVESCDRDFKVDDFGYSLQADKIWNLEQVKAFEAAPDTCNFIDVRGPDEFNSGCVTGAKNIPIGKLINMDTKTLKSSEERAKVLEEAGIDLSMDITLSCKGGIAATVGYASVKDLAKAKLAVYDGSWAEYSKN